MRERAVIVSKVAQLAYGPVFIDFIGEPGIGKTTMLNLLAQHAEGAAGALVLSSRASEFERDLEFGVFVHALDSHLGRGDDRLERSLGADVMDELGAIFPALRHAVGAGSPPRSASARFRGYRAIRSMLQRLAVNRPLVLTLDDLHWADWSSVELIGTLVRQPPVGRVLIAFAYRPNQAPDRLLRELDRAIGEGALERVSLGPLSQTESEALLADGVPSRHRTRLYQESGGNPFYLRQLAAHAGRAATLSEVGLGVPAAVTASLLAELNGVSKPAARLAQGAAVAGDPFDLDLAAEVAGLDRRAALATLDELIGATIVRRHDAPLRFAFRHPLVHRAVYESSGLGWRISAHALADAALMRRRAPPETRAYHVDLSASIGDAQAIQLLSSVAAEAIAPSTRARWLVAALRLAPAEDRQLRLRLVCQLGQALTAAGRLEDSRAVLVEALVLWPSHGDASEWIELVVLCAAVERLLGRHEQSRARLIEAAGRIEKPDRAGIVVAIELASERVMSKDPGSGREPALTAVRHATSLGDPQLLASALAVAGYAHFCSGDVDAARATVAEAGAMAASLADTALSTRPDMLLHLGVSLQGLDCFDAAIAHFDRGLAIARASGHCQLDVELTVGRARALVSLGRLAEALVDFEEAIEAARLSENPQALAYASGFSSFGHLESGNVQRAVQVAREAAAIAVDWSAITGSCAMLLGLALIESGEWNEGRDALLGGCGGPDLAPVFSMRRPKVYEALTRAEIGLGHVGQAGDWARRACDAIDGVVCDLPRAQADRAVATVLLAEGDVAEAAARALRSADRANSIHARVEAGRSRLVAGRAMAAAGQREQAFEQLRMAEREFAECGALRLRAQCVRELRRMGRRIARAGVRGDSAAGGAASLSGREREIAELVCDRRTNREIAERLFLSEKTIESHLRSVFIKLGVTSRADVARTMTSGT